MTTTRGWTLLAFYRSVAKSGYTVVTPCADDKITVVGTNYYRFSGDWVAKAMWGLSGAIANALRIYFKHSKDPSNGVETSEFRDQTGNRCNTVYCNYDIPNGAQCSCYADNGNNNQLEVGLVAVAPRGVDPKLREMDAAAQIPAGAYGVRGTGTATLVAGVWTTVAVTWSKTFTAGKRYKIVALGGHSATAYAIRIKGGEGYSMQGYAPGVPASDTNALDGRMKLGDFGEFDGGSPPNVEMIASAGDTAEVVDILVVGSDAAGPGSASTIG